MIWCTTWKTGLNWFELVWTPQHGNIKPNFVRGWSTFAPKIILVAVGVRLYSTVLHWNSYTEYNWGWLYLWINWRGASSEYCWCVSRLGTGAYSCAQCWTDIYLFCQLVHLISSTGLSLFDRDPLNQLIDHAGDKACEKCWKQCQVVHGSKGRTSGIKNITNEALLVAGTY